MITMRAIFPVLVVSTFATACASAHPTAPHPGTLDVRVTAWPKPPPSPKVECWIEWPEYPPAYFGDDPEAAQPDAFGRVVVHRREWMELLDYLQNVVRSQRAVLSCLEKLGADVGP